MKIWIYFLFSVFVVAALFVYFVPSIVAFKNGREHRWAIFILNLLLGVTLLGWIGALLWATAPRAAEEK